MYIVYTLLVLVIAIAAAGAAWLVYTRVCETKRKAAASAARIVQEARAAAARRDAARAAEAQEAAEQAFLSVEDMLDAFTEDCIDQLVTGIYGAEEQVLEGARKRIEELFRVKLEA